MAEMLDPGLEHLHRHGRVWRWTTERRRVIRQLEFDALLAIPVLALFVLSPGGDWWAPEVVVALVLASALASLIRFDIGSGSTSPLMIVHVPLWYAVPPAWIPVMVGLSFAIGRLIERRYQDDRPPLWRAVMGATDAAACVGPAAVLSLFGSPAVSIDGVWIFLLAFGAQALVDFALGTSASWFIHRVRPEVQGRLMFWIIGVDAALAPVGFLGALVMAEHPIALLGLMPLIAVLGEFARERHDRIDQAVELSTAYRGTAQLMGDVLEADDAYTGGEHTQGVVTLAVAVGLEMRLTPTEMRQVEFGALLHDIGKLRVPNAIINKAGSLTDAEWAVIRQHPVYGQEMLDRVGGALTEAGLAVRAHHERWDGNGYPDRLAGEAIPVAARIITVCDSFSAMTTTRTYRKARTPSDALCELDRCSGHQFDPQVVEALKIVLDRAGDVATSSGAGDDTPASLRAFGVRITT
jgi:HD domain